MPDLAEMLAQADRLLAENAEIQRLSRGTLRSLEETRKKLQALREDIVEKLAEVPQTRPHEEWR